MHTQCPKCRTIFNVTEQILAVKAGLVRCGDCENVFNATWNLVDEADELETQTPSPPPRAVSVRLRRDDERAGEDFPLPPREAVTSEPWPTPAPADDDGADVDGDDDPLAGDTDDWTAPRHGPMFDQDDDDDEYAHEDDDPHDEEENRATQRHERAFGPLVRDPGIERTDTSSVWEVLDDDDDVDEDISDEEIRRTLRLDRALDDEEHDDDDHDEYDNGDPGKREALDDTPVRAMRQADDPPAGMRREPAEPTGGRIEPHLDAAPSGGLSVNADDGLLPRRAQNKPAAARSPLRRKPAIQLKAPAAAPRPAPAGGRSERIDPNVHWVSIPDNDRRGAQFLWASGVLLMMVLVVLQVRFFLVDELYAIEGTRPYVSLFCDFAGCSAPQRADPGAIEIAQTRVDLHPEVPGAIRINVNLINRAAFAQPYPVLELTLSDTEGRIVGRRAYQPSDYLAERPGTALLDPGILAVAAINLAHPNENAVGFETRVVASAAD